MGGEFSWRERQEVTSMCACVCVGGSRLLDSTLMLKEKKLKEFIKIIFMQLMGGSVVGVYNSLSWGCEFDQHIRYRD